MKRSNEANLKVEQLDDRIMPSTTATNIVFNYTATNNTLLITATPGKDMVQLYSTGSSIGLISATPRPGMDNIATNGWTDYAIYDTGAPLNSGVKIVINGGEGADFIINTLGSDQYGTARIRGNAGDDAI